MIARPAALFYAAFLTAALLVATQPAIANPTLVIDADTGMVLHADQAGSPWYPASLTKLMTAYLTFERLRDDDQFTMATKFVVSKRATLEPPSKMGVPAGQKVSVGKALEALIVYSANDIAVVLAEAVAGSVPHFVERMNAAAARLGMTASRFRNPNGLPNAEQMTTARDLAILARALLTEFPEYGSLFTMDTLKWGKKRLRARNKMLRSFDGADGMKTGFICSSGYNLVASATRDGRRLIAVILGAPSGTFRTRMASHLLETAFARHGAPLIDFGSVETLSNDASRFVAPPDLRPQICDKTGDRPKITKASQLDGWGVMFGRYKTKKGANSALISNLAALRGVATAGKAAVVPGVAKSGYAAVLAGLSIDQMLAACDHLAKGGLPCTALNPAEVQHPQTAL